MQYNRDKFGYNYWDIISGIINVTYNYSALISNSTSPWESNGQSLYYSCHKSRQYARMMNRDDEDDPRSRYEMLA